MILLVDNFDSFTWNLAQALQAAAVDVEVVRNDAADLAKLLALRPSGVLLGPGPGRPRDSRVCLEVLRSAPPELPILGVCLGHQALVETCGGHVVIDPTPVHGRAASVHHDGRGLFAGLPNPMLAGRYHSLLAAREPWPAALELTAWTDEGLVMGVRHRSLPRDGVQFHPESILTPAGERLLANFARRCGERPRDEQRSLLRPRATFDSNE